MTDAIEQAIEALDKLARLGNAPMMGNSNANIVAQDALTALRQHQADTITIKRGDVPVFAMSHWEDFQERGEIMRHNEEGIELLAEILANAMKEGE